ncbi:hypothetical protein A2917_03475 [Candidatus Nomurabacteria bacterium RIFCSPLOWO2_01_FULL_42_17]|uniref:MYM-type domain-containing protein n=1 Tax=Candidatus Nomurabacteria bacterium RIFCSPLOWO2_01_FULL_42_17 TaxID=1801780 RepID=A0A1F6XNA2_9BACT|nr:MAG: hypothetical protein A2917_03475 [Candidatus Nomurabacteria bacterium RIFCSPLOWO2_01_FULL_42_17]
MEIKCSYCKQRLEEEHALWDRRHDKYFCSYECLDGWQLEDPKKNGVAREEVGHHTMVCHHRE